MVLWRPYRTNKIELTPKTDVLLIIGDWNAKLGSQETPGITGKFGLGVQNEAGQRLTEFCQENTLVIANTLFQQHKRGPYTWTSLDGQYQNQIDYILCSRRWRSSIQSTKIRPGADCGSDHDLLIAKFRCKLNKVGETTIFMIIQWKWQIQGMRSDRVPEEVYMEVHSSVHEVVIKTIPKEKKCKANGCLRRPYK